MNAEPAGGILLAYTADHGLLGTKGIIAVFNTATVV